MSFLLDTNVVSEWVKPQPDPNVVTWLAEVDEDRVFMSVASVRRNPAWHRDDAGGRRRERLLSWLLDELPARFEGRILGIDQRIAETWGIVMARGQQAGVTLGSMDAFFAATAVAHGLTLVTRNVRRLCTGRHSAASIPGHDHQARGWRRIDASERRILLVMRRVRRSGECYTHSGFVSA